MHAPRTWRWISLPTLCAALLIGAAAAFPEDTPAQSRAETQEEGKVVRGASYATDFCWVGDWNGDGQRDAALIEGGWGRADGRPGVEIVAIPSGEVLVRFDMPLSLSRYSHKVASIPDVDGDGQIDLIIAGFCFSPDQETGQRTTSRLRVDLATSSDRNLRRVLEWDTGIDSGFVSLATILGLPPAAGESEPRFAVYVRESSGWVLIACASPGAGLLWEQRLQVPPCHQPHVIAIGPARPETSDVTLTVGLAEYQSPGARARSSGDGAPTSGTVLVLDLANGEPIARIEPPIPIPGFGQPLASLPADGSPGGSTALYISARHLRQPADPSSSAALFVYDPKDWGLASVQRPALPGAPRQTPDEFSAIEWKAHRADCGDMASVSIPSDGNGPLSTWLVLGEFRGGHPKPHLCGIVWAFDLSAPEATWTRPVPDLMSDYFWGGQLAGEEPWARGTTGGFVLAGTFSPYGGFESGVYVLDVRTGEVVSRIVR